MFLDVFHGGILDGQELPSTVDSAADDVLIHYTGDEYRRAPELDTAMARGWVYQETETHDVYLPASGPRPVALQRTLGLTLQHVEEFTRACRRRGWGDETPVLGLLRFSGRVKRLYVKR